MHIINDIDYDNFRTTYAQPLKLETLPHEQNWESSKRLSCAKSAEPFSIPAVFL